MALSKKINLDNVLLFLFICLFISREEIFILPVRGQRLLMVLIFFISIKILLTKNISSVFLKKAKWIILVNIYLILIFVFGFGDANDLLQLLLTYLTATSFFIVGLYWGKNDKTHVLKIFFGILFVLTFVNLIPFVFNAISTGAINKRALSIFYGLEESPMIMFWPYIFIIGFVGYFLGKLYLVKKWQRFMFNFLFIIFVLTMIVSAFTAVVLMLTMALGFLIFFKFKDRINLIQIINFGIILGGIFFILKNIAEGTFGDLGGTASKVEAVFGMFGSNDAANFEEQLDTASATRYSKMDISYYYINKSPFVGNGYYFASVGDDINKQVASGHSSGVDLWAYFGLFAIPFYFIFINFITKSYKLANLSTDENKQIGYTICAVTATFFLISFSNPYLQFSSIDLIFLLGGWVHSQFYLLEKKRRQT